MIKSKITTPYIIAAIMTGCASVPSDSKENDLIAKKFMQPKEGMAAVYVIRNSPFGQTSVLELSINGISVAQTAPYTYVRFDLKAGRYYLGSRGENYQQRPLLLHPGEIHFIKQSVSIGWNDFRTELIPLSDQEGRQAVMSSTLAQKLMFDEDIAPMSGKN